MQLGYTVVPQGAHVTMQSSLSALGVAHSVPLCQALTVPVSHRTATRRAGRGDWWLSLVWDGTLLGSIHRSCTIGGNLVVSTLGGFTFVVLPPAQRGAPVRASRRRRLDTTRLFVLGVPTQGCFTCFVGTEPINLWASLLVARPVPAPPAGLTEDFNLRRLLPPSRGGEPRCLSNGPTAAGQHGVVCDIGNGQVKKQPTTTAFDSFANEVKAMKAVQCGRRQQSPCFVAQLIGTDGRTYLTMPRYTPGPLTTIVTTARSQPTLLQDVLAQVTLGLRYLWSRGWVHGDIKPDNIFLQRLSSGRLQVRIGDFGSATPSGQRQSVPSSPSLAVYGDLHYLHDAEVLQPDRALPRRDRFALVLVAYDLLNMKVTQWSSQVPAPTTAQYDQQMLTTHGAEMLHLVRGAIKDDSFKAQLLHGLYPPPCQTFGTQGQGCTVRR